jgi:hypothetical protein
MRFLILWAITSFLPTISLAQISHESAIQGDIAYSLKDYKKVIKCYEKVDFSCLNGLQITNFIISEYRTNKKYYSDSLITIWVMSGAMPNYVKGILSYRLSSVLPTYIDTLFSPQRMIQLNKVYGDAIASSPIEYYQTSKIYFHDQHLRFLEIERNKKVDTETFINSDSMNMIATKKFLSEYGFPTKKEWCKNLMFGVIHHYCAESFFTENDFDFFRQKMEEMVELRILSIKSYCYFVDKYSVFNGKKQVYGTYSEMEGLVGIVSGDYKKINDERVKVGYLLTIEDQLKYGL